MPAPMIFKSEKARNFLLKHGVVVTFRPKKRKKNIEKTWATPKYRGKKFADIIVRFLCEVKREEIREKLDEHVALSGFKTVDEWIEEIKNLNGGEIPKKGYLYIVIKLPVENVGYYAFLI
jgi:hypothetical protein